MELENLIEIENLVKKLLEDSNKLFYAIPKIHGKNRQLINEIQRNLMEIASYYNIENKVKTSPQ